MIFLWSEIVWGFSDEGRESAPLHLMFLRENIRNPAFKDLRCYEFVNTALEQSNSHKWQHVLRLHGKIQLEMPAEHRYEQVIPYHYACLAKTLRKKREEGGDLQEVGLLDVCPGDIFVYIDLGYNPDFSAREKENFSGGTHVGFVDEVIKDPSFITLRLIDASIRRYGRFSDPSNPEKRFLENSGSNVGYSKVVLFKTDQEGLFWCEIPGMGKVIKEIYILR